jgi:hypothetical protein
MPSPITTQGFTVQAQPGINYLDPRLFAGGLSEIVPNIGRGAGVVGGLYEMHDNAQMRPIRQSLANIQLREAENRLAMAPLEQQLAALRLGEAQQRAAIPTEIVENIDILGGGTRLAPQNPNASFADFQITEEYAPKIRRTGGTRVGAGGALTPFTKDETLATAADVQRQAAGDKLAAAAEARLAANQESLASYRQMQAETARIKAENDQLKAEYLQNNPGFGFVDVERADGKTYRQYFPKNNPQRIIHEVNRGEIGGDNFFNFFGKGQGGATTATGAAPGFSALSNQVLADLDAARGGGRTAPAAVPVAKETFDVGKTYTDATGNRAEYLGNGQWREVQ